MSKVKKRSIKTIKETDPRIKGNNEEVKKTEEEEILAQDFTVMEPSHLFFSYNPSLGPPFRILVDTNLLWQTTADKVDLIEGVQKCLLAKCIPIVTDCVMAELEKLGRKFHLALKLAKDPRIRRYKCGCKGHYADDCLVNTVTTNRCFIIATNDKDLRRRIRKIPGVPILYLHQYKFHVERLPDNDLGPHNF